MNCFLRVACYFFLLFIFFPIGAMAQDDGTGSLSGLIVDGAHASIPGAEVILRNPSNGFTRQSITNADGRFAFDLLPPAVYDLTIHQQRLKPFEEKGIKIDVGGVSERRIVLAPGKETVEVRDENPLVETQSSAISSVIEQRAIEDLPLNGRHFTDLALLTPGVTQDPRGLTSSSNGDLAFGGIRGYHSSFLVDGADNNNAFFAQARGRYRAPYQFSNEVIQEFRVSSNAYGADLGGAGGAVVNVVTRSGSNHFHGSGFYYLRDSKFNARPPFVAFKPADRQQQFGFTLGGPIKKDRVFFFAGFDQHVFHVPAVFEFANGSSSITPVPTNGRIAGDYEASDQALVFASASQLNTLSGAYPAALLGNAGFAKVDVQLAPKHTLNARLNTSRYYGANNVFFDPASPITNFAQSGNGEEDVATESASASLTSAISPRLTSHLRLQFSRDLQESQANSDGASTRIFNVLEGMGRSSILPRQTREHRLHLAEVLSLSGGRNSWKFGGEVNWIYIRNFFPKMFGGEYAFENIKVDPFTFVPELRGLPLTPLRAYAHEFPKFYEQNFGSAVSHPDAHEYSWFVQDAIRVSDHFALNLGARYDLETFRSDGLISNLLYTDSGKVPTDTNNIAPRVGFAYSIGNNDPLVIRGGYGIFFTQIPQIYTSAVETNNGVTNSHLRLDNSNFFDRQIFPLYPNPLVNCPPASASCTAPSNSAGKATSEVSAFAHNFQIPFVQQTSASLEKEVAIRLAIGAAYLYVHGQHLIRARDVNLPKPVIESYPIYDDSGTNFLGGYYTVASFATWQTTPSLLCPFPPCINDLQRPEPRLGVINVFESAASSVYHGLTLSVRRRMSKGVYFRLAYTLAHAIDDNQDALVAGAPASVQNSFDPKAERGTSVTDQRNRFVFSWIAEPRPFHQDHPALKKTLDDWKLAGIVTVGSGRPVNARLLGDANQDGNSENDRLPGVRRNSFTSPDYATTDMRLSRVIHASDRIDLEFLAEAFNILNQQNKRVAITDNGFLSSAAQFVPLSKKIGVKSFPAHFRNDSSFLKPTSAYAPRQVQFAVKLKF